ncbi:hypothetical protein FACS1894217_10250 [Clostridia bacterium]|nr:hypothetical protein FACS1894217_10250 [Clostridia bacterium]
MKKYLIAGLCALIINGIGFWGSALMGIWFFPYEAHNPYKSPLGFIFVIILYKITIDVFFKVLERHEKSGKDKD